MPESSVRFTLDDVGRDAQCDRNKYGKYFCLKFRLRAFEDVLMKLELNCSVMKNDSTQIAYQKPRVYYEKLISFH